MSKSLYIELSDTQAEELCKAEGWEDLFCSNCANEIQRIRYSHEPAYLAESGDVLCWDCSHCFECGEELVHLECQTEDCSLCFRVGTNPKKDPKAGQLRYPPCG